MRRVAWSPALAAGLATCVAYACPVSAGVDAGTLPVVVQQRFHRYSSGRTLYEREGILLVSTILDECRVQAWKDSHDDEARIAGRSGPLGFTILSSATKARWSRELKKDFVPVAARTPFRVLGVVSYRCSLPHMRVMSADDTALNQNEAGEDGTYYRIRILRGVARGKEVLWNPDYASIYADTGRPCFPAATSTGTCPLGS